LRRLQTTPNTESSSKISSSDVVLNMNTFLIGRFSVTELTNHLPLLMTEQTRIKVINNTVLFSIDHKTSTYQESLKNQVASNEDNEENK